MVETISQPPTSMDNPNIIELEENNEKLADDNEIIRKRTNLNPSNNNEPKQYQSMQLHRNPETDSPPQKQLKAKINTAASNPGGTMTTASVVSFGSISEDTYWENISNRNANVIVTIDETKMGLKLANILDREREMRRLAREQGIGSERWDGSLLYREVRLASVKNRCNSNGDFNIHLSIGDKREGEEKGNEVGSDNLNDSFIVNSSKSEQSNSIPCWTHMLQSTLVPYYSTGRIPIPEVVTGPDLLHMLEFFELVYSPALLDFQSYGTFVKVKLWGEYFFQRGLMADWIMRQIFSSTTPKKSVHLVTSPENVTDLGMYYIIKDSGKRCMLFDGGLEVNNETEINEQMDGEKEPSCSCKYSFSIINYRFDISRPSP